MRGQLKKQASKLSCRESGLELFTIELCIWMEGYMHSLFQIRTYNICSSSRHFCESARSDASACAIYGRASTASTTLIWLESRSKLSAYRRDWCEIRFTGSLTVRILQVAQYAHVIALLSSRTERDWCRMERRTKYVNLQLTNSKFKVSNS